MKRSNIILSSIVFLMIIGFVWLLLKIYQVTRIASESQLASLSSCEKEQVKAKLKEKVALRVRDLNHAKYKCEEINEEATEVLKQKKALGVE